MSAPVRRLFWLFLASAAACDSDPEPESSDTDATSGTSSTGSTGTTPDPTTPDPSSSSSSTSSPGTSSTSGTSSDETSTGEDTTGSTSQASSSDSSTSGEVSCEGEVFTEAFDGLSVQMPLEVIDGEIDPSVIVWELGQTFGGYGEVVDPDVHWYYCSNAETDNHDSSVSVDGGALELSTDAGVPEFPVPDAEFAVSSPVIEVSGCGVVEVEFTHSMSLGTMAEPGGTVVLGVMDTDTFVCPSLVTNADVVTVVETWDLDTQVDGEVTLLADIGDAVPDSGRFRLVWGLIADGQGTYPASWQIDDVTLTPM